MLDRVNWVTVNLLDLLIFVRKVHIPNLGLLVPFLHVKKFVVVVGGGGWWVCDNPGKEEDE